MPRPKWPDSQTIKFEKWLRGLALKGGKGKVDNIDARALGRVADELESLRRDNQLILRDRDYYREESEKLKAATDLLTGKAFGL